MNLAGAERCHVQSVYCSDGCSAATLTWGLVTNRPKRRPALPGWPAADACRVYEVRWSPQGFNRRSCSVRWTGLSGYGTSLIRVQHVASIESK